MKTMKKMMALALTMVMVLAMGTASFATGDEGSGTTTDAAPSITINAASTAAEGQTDTTEYTWYRIFEADIQEDPTQSDETQSSGKVAYYVDTEDKAAQITNTNLFNVTRVGETNKWYVELKSETTDADAIATAFAAMDLTKFTYGTFEQAAIAGSATSGPVDPGYYYITSTAGKNVVIQTLTAVEIDEKNQFPTHNKVVDSTDANAQIGDEISYTLTVTIPASANDMIVLTDVMGAGLTFKSIDDTFSSNVAYTFAPEAKTPAAVTANDNSFTLTIDKATVIANREKTLTIGYVAVLNNKAAVGSPATNQATLAYGNDYTSKPKETSTNTYSFDFDKVDGSNTSTKLTGAEFILTLDNSLTGTPINLIEVEEGKTYRVAMSEDNATLVTTIKTNGNTVTINGLDTDVTYYLVETKAPTGYNKLTNTIEVKAKDNAFAHQNVQNNKGSVLPSTGGIGTTIFYIIGAILVIGAGVILVARRRTKEN